MHCKRPRPARHPPNPAKPRQFTRREALALCGGAIAGSLLTGCSRDPAAPPTAKSTAGSGPLHYNSLTDIARLIESRQVSPTELTRLLLERIAHVDGYLKSYATLTTERALGAARQAERDIASGNYRGPLHGIPVAVKDLCYTRGTRTMGGLAVRRDFVPDYDATVVTRLERAGAVLLGKLNLTEGAMAGYHPQFPIPVNPWNADYWAGASSSGSGVATAAGLCFASLGTDTGGSIRFPSMANGAVGLKPTYGRVSRHGVLALAESLDHVGPMTRRTADAAIVLQAIAGHDANDPSSLREPVPDMLGELGKGIAGLRLGFDPNFATEGVDAGLVTGTEQVLEILTDLGATVVEVTVPEGMQELGRLWFPLCAFEAHKAHGATFPSRAGEYGPYFRDFLELGSTVTVEQYAAASQLRRDFNRRFEAVLEEVDAMVCPSGGNTFPVAPDLQYGDTTKLEPLFHQVQMQFTIPADFAGTPTLTVPCGFSLSGVPYAVQFMGRSLSEPLLCRIGHAYEEATPWHTRHPPI